MMLSLTVPVTGMWGLFGIRRCSRLVRSRRRGLRGMVFDRIVAQIAQVVAERVAQQIAEEIPEVVARVGEAIVEELGDVVEVVVRSVLEGTTANAKNWPKDIADLASRIFRR